LGFDPLVPTNIEWLSLQHIFIVIQLSGSIFEI
jgi:hypothetical protein